MVQSVVFYDGHDRKVNDSTLILAHGRSRGGDTGAMNLIVFLLGF